MKKSLLGIVAAGIVAISFTGCGSDEPEGLYYCDAGNNKGLTVKIDDGSWDIQVKDKWMIKEAMKKKKEGESADVKVNYNEDTKQYALNVKGTEKGGKEMEMDFLTFNYDKDKDMLNLISFQNKPIKRAFRVDSLSCVKK